MTRYLLFLAAAGPTVIAAGLELPRKGCFVEPGGGVRLVYGIRSNFLLGRPAMEGVISAACSQRYIVTRTVSEVQIRDMTGAVLGTREAAGEVVLGLGAEAVYIAASAGETVLRWQAKEWRKLPITVDGEILAISGRGEEVHLLLRQVDGVWLLRYHDQGLTSRTWLTERSAAAVLWSDGTVLLAQDTVLTVRSLGADRVHDVGAAIRSIGALQHGWAFLELADRRLAVELRPDGDRFYVLPGETE